MNKEAERLQKILSAYGVASRRAAEKMIEKGRVCVNGAVATTGQSAVDGVDIITVDGVQLEKKAEHIYIMLNKPQGYLTTVYDSRGRPTVMKLLKDIRERIYPVGRLDMDSEGLLLFTNDGDFAQKIMHPSYDILKTYMVEVKGDVEAASIALTKPIPINSGEVTAKKIEVLKILQDGGIINITVSEGKNRQVRKMCHACNLTVIKLQRVSIGALSLGSLASGRWRKLTDKEISSI